MCSSKLVRALVAASFGLGSIPTWAAAQSPPLWAAPPATSPAAPAAPSPVAPDAGAPEGDAGPAGLDPRLGAARALQQDLRALAESRLAVDVDPQSLFDVPLNDPAAVAVEVRRLRTLLGAAPPPASDSAALDSAPLDDALYAARLAVDRARLAFLERSPDERGAALRAHAERRAQADAEQPELAAQREARKKAELAAEQVAAERQRVMQQMLAAQSEASRAVAAERARLLGVGEAQSTFEVALHDREQLRAARAERVLGLRRRVEELLADTPEPNPQAASALFDRVRDELALARRELASALDEVGRSTSDVPRPGPDPLGELAAGAADLQQLRDELRTRAAELAAEEREARWSQARQLHEIVLALNRARRSLYPHLPSDERAELTSFGSAGRSEAADELDQLRVVTRYHVANLSRWATDGSWLGSARGALLSREGLEVIMLGALFLWWRRASRRTVEQWTAMSRAPSTALGARLEPMRERLLAVLTRIHRPLELLVLLWLARWVIGPEVASRLGLHLAWIIASWILGGLVVVNAIDGLGAPVRGAPQLEEEAQLRLRSLRLLGRLFVGVGLLLDLSAVFVLRGTLYAWLVRVAWLAVLPIALVLVRWWRPTIEQRCAARAKQSKTARWLAERASGPHGYAVAVAGGGYLLAVGAGAVARSQMAAFASTRRILAYLFRREVLRHAGAINPELRPLEPALRAVFDPDAQPGEGATVQANEAQERALDERLARGAGGIVAVVGERGSGKTVLARRVLREQPSTILLSCPPGGVVAVRAQLLEALGLPADAPDSALIARLAEPAGAGAAPPRAIVIDDAQHLVLPAVGGLDSFDALLTLARAASTRCTWIFCFGAVLWQFIEKARGVYPLFDDVLRLRPWSEQRIGELLRSRCAAAGIEPSFRALSHDEVDPADELLRARQTEADYHRLLWDASGGNPGIALHLWRDALRISPDGTVLVTLFSQPDARDLQQLSPNITFVLRSVLRLEHVRAEEIARSTMLELPEVSEALHFAERRGWIEQQEHGYRVTWSWLRTLTVFLQRRRMLLSWEQGGSST